MQYGYDARGRLNGVGSTGRSQSYTYHPLHSRIEAIEWSGAGGIQFKERRNYDVAGRLLAIHSDAMPGGVASPVTRYGYEFDNLGRRKKAVLVDGSIWDYGYNDRGEVTSAARKDAAGTTIPALGATYAYDGIGNRTTSTSPVLGQRTYTPNNLNQYSSITAAPFRTVVGRAPAAAPVAVNGTTLGAQHRTGEVFHFQLPLVSNVNSPVWLPASVSSQGTTIDRHFFVPKQVTAPQHDPDGNLVNDGRWVYLWDAENRLIQMESTVAAVQAGAPYRKLVFHYDAGGRRLARTVYHGTAAAPVFASSTRWLYDGWNPISEFSGTADTGGTITRTKSYTWGPDLSGTPQGAGGVGGLLAVIVHSGLTNSAYYPSYDGNGNIVAWTLEGTPAPVSRREYDAFGNTLVEQGVSPSAYGFSTKMQDAETGLYYYGYRFYDPLTGRWPSRDPIEERGGVNLYAMLKNVAIRHIDVLGRQSFPFQDDDPDFDPNDSKSEYPFTKLDPLDEDDPHDPASIDDDDRYDPSKDLCSGKENLQKMIVVDHRISVLPHSIWISLKQSCGEEPTVVSQGIDGQSGLAIVGTGEISVTSATILNPTKKYLTDCRSCCRVEQWTFDVSLGLRIVAKGYADFYGLQVGSQGEYTHFLTVMNQTVTKSCPCLEGLPSPIKD